MPDSRLDPAMFRAAAARKVLASVFAVTVAVLASASPATAGDSVAKDVPTAVVLSPRELVVIDQGRVTVALGDSAPDVRVQAVRALRIVHGARAIPVLGRVLVTDPDVTVRRAAAQMLGSFEDPAAISALSVAAQDADALVRREITRALNRRAGSTSP